MRHRTARDVFALSEVAQAAGVPAGAVDVALRETGVAVLPGGFLTFRDAVALGRAARSRRVGTSRDFPAPHPVASREPSLFAQPDGARREPAAPVAVSLAAHGLAFGLVALVTSAGVGPVVASSASAVREPMRLVFLAAPGPGGGGGGGGARQALAAPKAMRRGSLSVSSPLPERKRPQPTEAPPPRPETPPPPQEAQVVQAPVATVAADERDRAGVLDEAAVPSESRGPGAGAGVGTGTGTGIGEGQGSGVGEGEGGGTGGGPYRPGSGIEPPRLLREVRPDYTDEARRAGLSGEVLLEIVVRRDGSVGDVRVLHGLGRGLDARAVDAVKQWRFSPARRKQAPVDVLVEVAVEFRLR